MEIEELKNEKLNIFDKVKSLRRAYDFFERSEIEKIINEGSLRKKDKILNEVKSRWNSLSSNDKSEFKKLEKLDEKRVKSEQELKKKFEEIKSKFFARFDNDFEE